MKRNIVLTILLLFFVSAASALCVGEAENVDAILLPYSLYDANGNAVSIDLRAFSDGEQYDVFYATGESDQDWVYIKPAQCGEASYKISADGVKYIIVTEHDASQNGKELYRWKFGEKNALEGFTFHLACFKFVKVTQDSVEVCQVGEPQGSSWKIRFEFFLGEDLVDTQETEKSAICEKCPEEWDSVRVSLMWEDVEIYCAEAALPVISSVQGAIEEDGVYGCTGSKLKVTVEMEDGWSYTYSVTRGTEEIENGDVPEDGTVVVNVEDMDIGTYTLTINAASEDDAGIRAASIQFKKTNVLYYTVDTKFSKEYDGEELTIEIKPADDTRNYEVEWQYRIQWNDDPWTSGLPSITEVGEITYVIRGELDGYEVRINGEKEAEVTFCVEKPLVKIALSVVQTEELTYNGEEQELDYTVSVVAVDPQTSEAEIRALFSISGLATGRIQKTDAGTYSIDDDTLKSLFGGDWAGANFEVDVTIEDYVLCIEKLTVDLPYAGSGTLEKTYPDVFETIALEDLVDADALVKKYGEAIAEGIALTEGLSLTTVGEMKVTQANFEYDADNLRLNDFSYDIVVNPHALGEDFEIWPDTDTYAYGDEIESYSLWLDGLELTEGKDYTSSWEEEPESVGLYVLTFEGLGNYTGICTKTITIQPRQVTITISAEGTVSGLEQSKLKFDEETNTFSYDDDNYDVTFIVKTSVEAEDWTYDGTTAAEHIAFKVGGQTIEPDVCVYYKGDEKLDAAPSDVGEYTVKASWNDSTIEDAEATFTVGYKSVIVKAEDAQKVYGDDDPEWVWTIIDEQGDPIDDDQIVVTIERDEGEDAGEYTISVKGDEFQGNYRVTYEDGTLTINPQSAENWSISRKDGNIVVQDGQKVLEEGTDYIILSCQDADDPDYEMIVAEAKSANYIGTKEDTIAKDPVEIIDFTCDQSVLRIWMDDTLELTGTITLDRQTGDAASQISLELDGTEVAEAEFTVSDENSQVLTYTVRQNLESANDEMKLTARDEQGTEKSFTVRIYRLEKCVPWLLTAVCCLAISLLCLAFCLRTGRSIRDGKRKLKKN